MAEAFNGSFFFKRFDGTESATKIMQSRSWGIDTHNAPYLAGLQSATNPGEISELTFTQAFGPTSRARLPQKGWTQENTLTVVGDVSQALPKGTDFILAQTSNFKQAGELAEKLGYRSALAGEFIQLMEWLVDKKVRIGGWFFCYAGRTPKYAILSEYSGYSNPPYLTHCFDTYIDNQIEKGHIDCNADSYCFFVRI